MTPNQKTLKAHLVNYKRISCRDSQVDVRHLEFIFTGVFSAEEPLYHPGDQITLHLPYPRVFAVASSQLEVRNAFHLTVRMDTVIESDTLTYDELAELIARPIEFSVTRQPNFHLPTDTRLPIILLAEDIGIAPFRGFIQHRKWQLNSGANWLFVGDQYCSGDILYQEEWQGYECDNILTCFNSTYDDLVCTSSLAEEIDKQRTEIWAWLLSGAVIYQSCSLACSDQLEIALLDLVREQGKLTVQEASSYLRHLKQNQLYQRMIYV